MICRFNEVSLAVFLVAFAAPRAIWTKIVMASSAVKPDSRVFKVRTLAAHPLDNL